MKLSRLFVAIMAALMFFSVAQAADNKEEESSPANSLELISYRGDVAAKLYSEHEVMENLVVYVNATKQKGFGEITVGPAYYITPELQVGVSAGVAHYASADEDAKSNHKVVSGFVYYKSDAVEGELAVARYSRDSEPWWYQAYVQVPISNNWAAGIFGEASIGWGPRLAFAPHKRVTLWLSPLIKREGDNRLVGGIAVVF